MLYNRTVIECLSGSPDGSDDKESACNVGDLSLIPGSGRSPGEWKGYPLQYSCRRIPWTEEPGGLQSMGSYRVKRDWATEKHTYIHTECLSSPYSLFSSFLLKSLSPFLSCPSFTFSFPPSGFGTMLSSVALLSILVFIPSTVVVILLLVRMGRKSAGLKKRSKSGYKKSSIEVSDE